MPEKSLLTREQLVRLNEHLPDKDKTRLSPEQATMSRHNSPPQPTDLAMTDAEAAQVLADHTATLETEAEETTRWLNEHGIDTCAGVEVDIEEAMKRATADGEDMFNQAEKIKVMVARRASAVLVLRALGVAAMHTDKVFKGMIAEGAEVAKRGSKAGIFDVELGDSDAKNMQEDTVSDAVTLEETRKETNQAVIMLYEDLLIIYETLYQKQQTPGLKNMFKRRIDDFNAYLGAMRSGAEVSSPVELEKLEHRLKDFEKFDLIQQDPLLKDKFNILINNFRAQRTKSNNRDGRSAGATDDQHESNIPIGHEAWFEGQRFTRVGSAKRETHEVLEDDAGEVDALSVSEVSRKRQRRHGTGASQDDPVIL